MAYDAPDYTVVLWDSKGPYWKTGSGKKTYIPPITAAQYQNDPKMQAWAKSQGASIDYSPVASGGSPVVTNNSVPGSSLFRERGVWNSAEGGYDQGINWTNIAAIGIGGAIAAPFVVGALAGAAAPAYGPLAGGYGAATTSATVPAALAESGAIAAGAAGGAAAPAALAGTAPATTAPTVGAIGTTGAVAPTAAALPAAGVPVAAAPAYGPLAGGYGAATTAIPAAPAALSGAGIVGTSPSWAGIAQKAIPAATNIIGNVMQKNAIGDAVNAQTAGQAKALEAERAGGERAIGILSPWATVGAAANNRLGELLHLTPPLAVQGQMPVTSAQQASANSFVPTAVRNSPTASQVPQGPGPYANWPIYQAPDGSKRRVDPQQAAAAEAAGAQRVG